MIVDDTFDAYQSCSWSFGSSAVVLEVCDEKLRGLSCEVTEGADFH